MERGYSGGDITEGFNRGERCRNDVSGQRILRESAFSIGHPYIENNMGL